MYKDTAAAVLVDDDDDDRLNLARSNSTTHDRYTGRRGISATQTEQFRRHQKS
jgi:hypothetical protein